jgi:hypothetical protein
MTVLLQDEEEDEYDDDDTPRSTKTSKKKSSSKASVSVESSSSVDTRPEGDVINVFTVASGHMYERLQKIMILSVLNHTQSRVKFWFISNYMSPHHKQVRDASGVAALVATATVIYSTMRKFSSAEVICFIGTGPPCRLSLAWQSSLVLTTGLSPTSGHTGCINRYVCMYAHVP